MGDVIYGCAPCPSNAASAKTHCEATACHSTEVNILDKNFDSTLVRWAHTRTTLLDRESENLSQELKGETRQPATDFPYAQSIEAVDGVLATGIHVPSALAT